MIITGGSSGLGLALGELLAGAGARVSLIGRQADKLRAAARAVGTAAAGGPVLAAVADVVDRGEVRRAIHSLVAQHGGRCDMLIACAGSPHPGAVDDLDDSAYAAQMGVHFDGTRHAIDAVLPAMRSRAEGTIVTVSSAQVFRPGPGLSAHVSAKTAVAGLAAALLPDLRPAGIEVVCVFPRAVATEHHAFETVLLGGDATTSRAVPARKAAKAIIKGLERGDGRIYCDRRTRLLVGLLGPARRSDRRRVPTRSGTPATYPYRYLRRSQG